MKAFQKVKKRRGGKPAPAVAEATIVKKEAGATLNMGRMMGGGEKKETNMHRSFTVQLGGKVEDEEKCFQSKGRDFLWEEERRDPFKKESGTLVQ